MKLSDEKFMRIALQEAKKAFALGEVPVGAVLVYQDKIISQAHNRVEGKKDATEHAEMICLREGSEALDNWRLVGATLYTTLEPCSMCAGALLLSRVDRIVFGAPDIRHGAYKSFIDLLARKHPTHQIEVAGGVLEEESAHLMKSFFKRRRDEKNL